MMLTPPPLHRRPNGKIQNALAAVHEAAQLFHADETGMPKLVAERYSTFSRRQPSRPQSFHPSHWPLAMISPPPIRNQRGGRAGVVQWRSHCGGALHLPGCSGTGRGGAQGESGREAILCVQSRSVASATTDSLFFLSSSYPPFRSAVSSSRGRNTMSQG